ncbi:hypothetical protein [Streptomyces sp. SID3343]|uniref:hypothetical protein n=1 Tax=Streptomyces sp. SID3343 TaxID=2690260 RepID=UPI00136C1138|nr:hypothetical protein [Streptomyces sp. SID3343]MYV97317.1 hypothetical protein [Streptomyces sp. SID3343]
MLTDSEYAHIRRWSDAATAGPWTVVVEDRDPEHALLRLLNSEGRIVASTAVCVHDHPDALDIALTDLSLVARSRVWIPVLLAEVADLRQRLAGQPDNAGDPKP